MNELLGSLSAHDLRRAAELKEKIDSLQNELATILGSESVASTTRTPSTRRRMSREARERIAAGAMARWARINGTNEAESPKRKGKKRSPAVRARLAAIARKRWRDAKAAGKMRL